jgi:hypothetical protein
MRTLRVASLLAALLLAPAPAATASRHQPAAMHARSVLPFISDDYAKALQVARARKLPLFIESWAPW